MLLMLQDYYFQPSAPSPAVSESLPIFEDRKPFDQSEPRPQEPPLPTPRSNIPLTARQKGLIVTHFDTGASFGELAAKFRVSIEDIEYIILNRAEVIRDQTAALMADNDMDDDRERIVSGAKKRSRVRRTSFVGLNILMWRFFKDCRDNGIVLNGKLLKEHAMMISRQLGLENFKGSEGWLDAFKRRHRIDLKLMSGVPVNYEETDDDRMEDDHDDNQNISRQFNAFQQVHREGEGDIGIFLVSVAEALIEPDVTGKKQLMRNVYSELSFSSHHKIEQLCRGCS
ncbi:centromere binding protein B, DNA binding protein [Cooperia oncophora]